MELATGEFFLRESVKKRKKMEEIKVSICGGVKVVAFHLKAAGSPLWKVAFVKLLPKIT